MVVTVLSHDRMCTVALPANVTGGHWLVDADRTRLAFIEGKAGSWCVDPVPELGVRSSAGIPEGGVVIDPRRRAVLNLVCDDDRRWNVVFYPDDAGYRRGAVYGFEGDAELAVGREPDNDIVYATRFVSAHHARLLFREGSWSVVDEGSGNGVFVNGRRIVSLAEYPLELGDVVSVLNLHIAVGSHLFSCNGPGGLVTVAPRFVAYRAMEPEPLERRAEPERALFYPAPRFARAIEPKTFNVDAPPQREREDETTLLMRIGPSLVMALASVLSASVSVSTLAGSDGSMIRALPMVGMAVAMLLGSVLWPILSSRSQKKSRALKETKRVASYSQYLSGVLADVAREEALQREILNENRVSVRECLNRALTGDVRLMDRTPLHADYLELRLGLGEEPLRANIRFPERHFSMEDDEIRRAVDEQAAMSRTLSEVPVSFSLIEKPVLGVVGEPARTRPFVRGLMVQIAALTSYANVKLMVLADEAERGEWDFVLHLPHCLSDDRSARYVAFGLEEAAELGMFVERVLEARRNRQERVEPRDEHPYYVIVCASETLAERADAVRAVVQERRNLGISLVAMAREMRDLPLECRSVIGVEADDAYLLERDDPTGARRRFQPDINVTCDAAASFAFALSRVRLDIRTEAERIPERLGFLEMERVGSVGHLSIASRWAESNASASLACPVGLDAQGDPFLLNLHEKFHGPHGLIAGTTGSGKSEFIITYILSMAVTYSPNDVAFVLIDYKGGGLAKAFDNERVRLPHLAGVITNLDGAAITRSLVSIKSELKRRQALFNRARDIAGGDNVDIYDYLDLFRQGRVTEPCPHLFIVADEFAELKQQEPEFMDELISAARIGRSLGVHLILATQKPSGVVNDQIWSNARFKVCLKVSDEADSKEMIRRPDAAALTQAGRFYLLVGYNEYFALGQAAYAGARYAPQERYTAPVDDAVTLISDTGRQLVTVKPERRGDAGTDMSEAVATLLLVEETARKEGLRARQLWLEPVPALVTGDGLRKKYGVAAAAGAATGDAAGAWAAGAGAPVELAPVVGELDDPERQRQALLTLPLSQVGSTLAYGSVDSGIEVLLRAILYDLLRTWSPADLNVYALDFGSESLRAFAEAPQVGDVLGAGDEEKMGRFFDMMAAEQERRRGELTRFGGSFERYRAAGGTLPAVLVLVNDVAALLEGYPKLEDRLLRFVREAGRNGIYLVMTGDGTSSVRVRMRQSFRQVLAIDLADTSDYAMIFGTMRGLPIPHGLGRGLVKLEEGVYEFQAAHLTDGGDDYGFAAGFAAELADRARRLGVAGADPVPTVPARVTPEVLRGLAAPSADELPFGVFEDTLEAAAFDFEESAMVRAVFQRRKSGAAFMRGLVPVAAAAAGWEVTVLDAAGLLGSEKPQGCAFATRKADAACARLEQMLARAAEGPAGGAAADAGPRRLVIVSGIAQVIGAADFDSANKVKDGLRGLPLAGGVRLLLVDALADVSYNYDDWFKAQLTNKNGLWVGPGIDAQNAFSCSYTPGLAPDSSMRDGRGYLVDGGVPRLVRLVSAGA